MSVELDGVNNILKTDTVSEVTSANGVTIDGLSIKDAKLVTANSVIEANMSANSVDSDSYVNGSIDTAHIADGQITVGKLATTVFTGATDIGAAIVDADLFLMDDGAGGTIRKTAASRLKTYIPGVGKILQVQSVQITGTVTSVTSSSFTATEVLDIITPTASSSKVLVIMNMSLAMYEDSGTGNEFQAAIYRDINGGGFGRIYAGQGNTYGGLSGHASGEITAAFPTTLTFVDAPNTTAAVTYKLFINVSNGNSVNTGSSSMERSVTLMEIGA